MRPADAQALARKVLREATEHWPAFRPEGWRIVFDRSVKRFGQCKHAGRTISLSRPLVLANDRPVVEDTIRHEIAHAAIGAGHGHDYVWRNAARTLGASPERCYSASEVVPVPAPWYWVCERGCRIPRYRKPRAGMQASCKRHGEKMYLEGVR